MDEATTFIEVVKSAGPAVLMFILLAGFLGLAYRLGIPITKGLVESLEALQEGWTQLTDNQAKHHEKMYEGMQKIMEAQEKRIEDLERKVAEKDQEIKDLRAELKKIKEESASKIAEKDERIKEILTKLKKAEEERDKANQEVDELRAALSGLEEDKPKDEK
jgi:uncharacterized protein HemX